MTIGERIKQLRKQKDLTQETLANYLCVSCQAVSKWENGAASPDLSLIVPLAKIFGITTDELLGAETSEADRRKEELKNAYDATFRNGDCEEMLAVTATAIKEFPGDMYWLCEYAWVLTVKGAVIKNEALLDKALDTFLIVLKQTDDDSIKARAIPGVVARLCEKGLYDEAKRYADQYPASPFSQDEKQQLIVRCSTGVEKRRQQQSYLYTHLYHLVQKLVWYGYADEPYSYKAAKAIIKAMIPDENVYGFHYDLYRIAYLEAREAGHAGDDERAIAHIREAMHHARKMDELFDTYEQYHLTSPLLDELPLEGWSFGRSGSGESSVECVQGWVQNSDVLSHLAKYTME